LKQNFSFSETKYFKCTASDAVSDILITLKCTDEKIYDNTQRVDPCIVKHTAGAPSPHAAFVPNTFCAKQKRGRYSLLYSTKCKQCINCYSNNGMKGFIYSCSGSTLFEKSKAMCVENYACTET
jgi:hypothetical protein